MFRNLIAVAALYCSFAPTMFAESETCKKGFPKELLQHATIDANYSFTKFARVPFEWVTVTRATCKKQRDDYNVTIWFRASEKADKEFVDAATRCRIEYTFNETKKLTDTKPSCQ
jgi:hypothetical protein